MPNPDVDPHSFYVNPLKGADLLAPEEREGRGGSGINFPMQLKPFRNDLSRSPRGAFTVYDIIILRLKYTLFLCGFSGFFSIWFQLRNQLYKTAV